MATEIKYKSNDTTGHLLGKCLQRLAAIVTELQSIQNDVSDIEGVDTTGLDGYICDAVANITYASDSIEEPLRIKHSIRTVQ